MSHFTVLVIGDNIEAQMAPYYESTDNSDYLIFKSTEREDMVKYMTETMVLVTLPDGTTTNEYDQKYYVWNKDTKSSSIVFPEGTIKEEKKFNEVFKSFEDYKAEWFSHEKRDEEMGEYGYWHNPNARWDWFVQGGRWTGYFKAKAGTKSAVGQSGDFGNKPKDGWVDSLRLCDIDFSGMKADVVKEANETYDKLEDILKGQPLPSWNAIYEKNNEDIDAARNEYHNLKTYQDLCNAGFHIMGDYVEKFGNSRAEYIKKCKNMSVVPFAFVKDGKWYQKGEMGWFGMSSNQMTQEEWNKQFWEMIKSLDKESLLTLVDCHI